MPHAVSFTDVSAEGLETSPVADALAGLRANESRYLKNKYDHDLMMSTPEEDPKTLAWVTQILASERDISISSPPLEVSTFEADGIRFAYVLYESGLGINVMYALSDEGKRAVGFKLSAGMDIPAELADKFKFARQRSKLAGEIRGSFFVIKSEHPGP